MYVICVGVIHYIRIRNTQIEKIPAEIKICFLFLGHHQDFNF